MIKLDDKFTIRYSPHEQLVMLRLIVGADDDGISHTSYRTLANDCGLSLQTCRNVLSSLANKGDIDTIANPKGTFFVVNKCDDYRFGKKKGNEQSKQVLTSLQSKCKEREKAFENSLIPFVTSRGGTYEPTMIRAFFNYWTERNKSGTKMRFELEKTWETAKRLQTWAARNNTYKSSLTLKTNEMNYDKTTDWG
ncbi:MAG: hypothetical protein HG466_000755 [Prevotella sp.]|nr:hypothetical protein [Prevotella sp.]